MLTVYDMSIEIGRKIGKEPVKDIENWFEEHLSEIVIDDTVKRIITYIDGEEFISHEIEKDRLRELSMGAKAVICVYTFPKVVFDLEFDYGENKAVTCAFTLPRGRFRLDMWDRQAAEGYPDEDKDIFNKVRVVTWLGTRICKSVYETYQYFTFSDRNSWGLCYEDYNYYGACGLKRAIDLEEYNKYQTNKSKVADFSNFVVAVYEKVYGNLKIHDEVIYPGFVHGQGYAIRSLDPYDYDLLGEERKVRIGNHDPFDEKVLKVKYDKAVARIKRARQRTEQKPEQGDSNKNNNTDGEEVEKC